MSDFNPILIIFGIMFIPIVIYLSGYFWTKGGLKAKKDLIMDELFKHKKEK